MGVKSSFGDLRERDSNTRMLFDYHMHTPLCGHATGHPREYAAEAVRKGIGEIGFS